MSIISVMDELLHLNKVNHKKFHFRVLSEYLFTSQCCWAFPKNSWLIETFDEKLGIMAENGLIDYLLGKYMDPQYLHIKEPKRGPRKLNISQLLGGFEVCFGGLSIAAIIFCLEIISRTFKLQWLQIFLEMFM